MIEQDRKEAQHGTGQNEDALKQIIMTRKKSCYYFKGKVWIYEYCHLKSARQVSRDKVNGNHEEYALGRYYPPRRGLSFNRELNYLSTEFFDGSYCELLGLPRRSKIRFICADDKQTMYVSNVMETSACSYDFLVHVPELCSIIPKHGIIPSENNQVVCPNYNIRNSRIDSERSTSKSKGSIDGLDQMLGLIESTYSTSNLLTQYKTILNKAAEKLKSRQVEKGIDDFKSSDDSLLQLLSQILKPEETKDESEEDTKNNFVKDENA